MLVKIPDYIQTEVWNKIPQSVKDQIGPKVWLVGGAIRDLIIGEIPVDWDIFKTGLTKIRQLITTEDGYRIDLVTLPVPILERVKEIDYRCCILGIGRTAGGMLISVMDPLAYDDCIQKRLVVNPKCVYFGKIVQRRNKFINRGWCIDEHNRQQVLRHQYAEYLYTTLKPTDIRAYYER